MQNESSTVQPPAPPLSRPKVRWPISRLHLPGYTIFYTSLAGILGAVVVAPLAWWQGWGNAWIAAAVVAAWRGLLLGAWVVMADRAVDHWRRPFRWGLGMLIIGFVPDADLPSLYNLCDVFVMPNRVTEGTLLQGDIEGFGISFLEAGACEKPVVAGRSGGAVEAVLHNRTGLLVDPRSEADVAGALQRLLDDPELAQTLGRQARQRIEREFDWRILARQVEEIL